jgi:hypothetical protein
VVTDPERLEACLLGQRGAPDQNAGLDVAVAVQPVQPDHHPVGHIAPSARRDSGRPQPCPVGRRSATAFVPGAAVCSPRKLRPVWWRGWRPTGAGRLDAVRSC